MSVYREYRYYSPRLDGEAARLSMANARGSEFYMIVPVRSGRAYREARERALDMLDAAIARGEEPGEVTAAIYDDHGA